MNRFVKPFFWGIIAAFLALVLELTISVLLGSNIGEINEKITFFMITAVFSEEIIKTLIVFKVFLVDTENNLAASAGLAGIGFAITETFFVLFNEIFFRSDVYLGIIGIFLIHIATFLIIARLLAKSRNPSAAIFPIAFLTLSIHFFYNFMVINAYSQAIISVYLLIVLFISIWHGLKICQNRQSGL